MSFLNGNNSEYLSARITQKGRNSIAKGDFKISYFVIGDSEYNYDSLFSTVEQGVLTPFDKDTQVKYPLKLDNTNISGTTIYGIPIVASEPETIRNVMGPAGFVSDYKTYNFSSNTGTTVECLSNEMDITELDGTSQIIVPITSGTTYQDCGYITIVLDTFDTTGDLPLITGTTNSLLYKITGVTTGATTETLFLDRNTPDLTGLSGSVSVVCNSCEMEFDTSGDVDTTCIPQLPDTDAQHNPWTLNVVWGQKPTGFDVSGDDESLSGFTSNKYTSTKEFLGYGKSNGQVTNTGTTYTNTYDEVITLSPEEQKCIAIIHYSEIGDIVNDPDRFFKYDDYISTSTGNTITADNSDDYEFFEVYIPFLIYHRNTGNTLGAIFHMSESDKTIISNVNNNLHIKYRDLLDEQNLPVGKVFQNNKLIVFDDQEIVAALDYKSNRRYTLPAPKISLVPTDSNASNSIMSGTTGQTMFVTYAFEYVGDTSLNGLPCNYFTKITGTTTPSNVTIKFDTDEFQNLKTIYSGVTNGFIASKFHILAQRIDETDSDNLPNPNNWVKMNYTIEAGGDNSSLIDPIGLRDVTFTIDKTKYDAGTTFDLNTHLGDVYSGSTTLPQFGDEQPFAGSVKLVRATDIEEMKFFINLPSGKFSTSQNPTYVSGNPKITEVALLNSNKEALVMAKTSKPITRTGTQVFAVKLDF